MIPTNVPASNNHLRDIFSSILARSSDDIHNQIQATMVTMTKAQFLDKMQQMKNVCLSLCQIIHDMTKPYHVDQLPYDSQPPPPPPPPYNPPSFQPYSSQSSYSQSSYSQSSHSSQSSSSPMYGLPPSYPRFG
jgi:hypothetical protein